MSKRRYHPSEEDWVREGMRPDALENQSHLLHGFIHCSGFGHLLRINSSSRASGAAVMDLWDRLCKALRVRKITLEDWSRKGSMELRLLLSVAYGTTWFGRRWNYTFHKGSFGVTLEDYQDSVNELANLNLDRLIEIMGEIEVAGASLLQLVNTYRTLADPSGPHEFTTLSDLLCFLLRQCRLHPPRAATASSTPPPEVFDAVHVKGSWSQKRVQKTAQLIIDELEKQGMMTRKALREQVKGTTGLLDNVLATIGGHIVGNHVVRRTENPDTGLLEFSLDHLPGGAALDDAVATPSAVQRDILWVYNHVLLRVRPRAAEKVLHSKRWAKEWKLQDDTDDQMRVWCRWIPHNIEPTPPEQPSELLVLHIFATMSELKKEAENAFRDTYCGMEGFRVATMEGMPGEEAELMFLCEAAQKRVAQVCVRGDGADLAGEPVYEGGRESLTVKCSCGTTTASAWWLATYAMFGSTPVALPSPTATPCLRCSCAQVSYLGHVNENPA